MNLIVMRSFAIAQDDRISLKMTKGLPSPDAERHPPPREGNTVFECNVQYTPAQFRCNNNDCKLYKNYETSYNINSLIYYDGYAGSVLGFYTTDNMIFICVRVVVVYIFLLMLMAEKVQIFYIEIYLDL